MIGSVITTNSQWTGSDAGGWTQIETVEDGWWPGRRTDPHDRVPGSLLHAELVSDRLLYSVEPAGSEFTQLWRWPSEVVVVDATTLTPIRVTRPGRITAVAFDEQRDTVLAGTEHGDVVSFGLTSGTVVAEFTATERFEIEALGARADGVVVVVSDAWIELLDPEGRTVGASIAIPASEETRVRRDGAVVLVPTDDVDTILVIDPRGGPLAEQGWTVDPDAVVAFGAGSAGVVGRSGAEVIDLASGERASVDLNLSGGDSFDPVAIVPEAEGYLAWDSGRTVARWRDTGVVEQIDLWSGSGRVDLGRDDLGEERHAADGFVAAGAAAVFLRDNPTAVYRFDPTPGELALLSTVRSPPIATVAAAPAPDGGLHLVLDTGVVRTYDTSARRRWVDHCAAAESADVAAIG